MNDAVTLYYFAFALAAWLELVSVVCLSVRGLKGNWLKLSTPELTDSP